MYLISQCLRNRKAILYNNTAAAILDCGGVEILQLQLAAPGEIYFAMSILFTTFVAWKYNCVVA